MKNSVVDKEFAACGSHSRWLLLQSLLSTGKHSSGSRLPCGQIRSGGSPVVANRSEFKPFGVESRARHYRLAFLVDPDACPPELLDALFEANYGLWGGRFNPIIPVRNGEIDEAFWSLLRYVDPDLIYTYTPLSQITIDRVGREIGPWRIEAHPPHLSGPDPPAHYSPSLSQELVKSSQVLPLLMSQSSFIAPTPITLLTYFTDWKTPLNRELVRLVARNFGIAYENAYPFLLEEWPRLQIQNNWTPWELFHCIAHTPNLLFPFQGSAAHAIQPPRSDVGRDEYCILVGDSAETWLYFWNHIFLVHDFLRLGWNSLCLAPALLREESFVGPLREFLKHHARRSGSSPSSLTLLSFECSESELSELKARILNGLDVIPRSKKLGPGEFPTLDVARPEIYVGWGSDSTTYQQGTSKESLFSPPRSRVPIDRGIWVMDLRVRYFPQFDFYGNEVLSWKLPRRAGVAEAFFNQRRCRVDANYCLSVEMRHLEPFILRVPEETEMFHRVAGVIEIDSYDSNLRIVRKKPRFCRLSPWDKGLYLNGILEIFGGLQSASRFLGHSFWRGIFERLSVGAAEKEAGLFERVRNTLEKKRSLITSQLAGGNPKPIDWLSNLVIRHARELHVRQDEISFTELESSFQEQRERFMTANAGFRKASSPEEIDEDRKAAKADLIGVLQELTDRGVLQQGVGVRCTNCGSWLWREIGSLRQRIECDGCNATVPVAVESVWRYRLNSLVRNGIALHGCVPVISALRYLRERARESFIYTHGVALFKEYGDAKPEAELDLLCILDGRLVCGEVKSSVSDFTREELAKLARIATDIRADQVAISAFNDRGGLMQQHSDTLASLLHVGCTVVTCGPSQSAFDPQPYP
jgi:hypothetical protein